MYFPVLQVVLNTVRQNFWRILLPLCEDRTGFVEVSFDFFLDKLLPD